MEGERDPVRLHDRALWGWSRQRFGAN
jgi:hypothetical protein